MVYNPQSLATLPIITAQTGFDVNMAFQGTFMLCKRKMPYESTIAYYGWLSHIYANSTYK